MRALHVKKIHGIDFATINVVGQDVNGLKRKRVKTACDSCRKRKLRCDGDVPCRHCRNGDISCQNRSTATTTLPAIADQRRSPGDSGEDVTTLEMENQGQANEQMSTSITTSCGSLPIISPLSQEGPLQEPDPYSLPICGNYGTNALTAMISDSVTVPDAGNALQIDDANGIWPDFWQMPLMVTTNKLTRLDGYR